MLLEQEWNAWYDHSTPGRSAKDYDKGLFPLCTVKSVEDFWGCYNNMPALHTLDTKCGFHFMTKGVKPAWEDLANQKGGIWRLRVKKEDATCMWKEILMALVGDVYKDTLEVNLNGVSIANKQNEYVFTLWVDTDSSNVETIQYFLDLSPHVTLITDPFYQSCSQLLNQTLH